MVDIKVISLCNSMRRKYIKNELNGYHFDFFNAIDKNNNLIKSDFNSKISKIIYGRELSRAEIGCALSHKLVIKDVDKNFDWHLILEDDVLIQRGFDDFYKNIGKISFDDASILVLGFSKMKPSSNLLRNLKIPLFREFEINGTEFGINPWYNYFGTCAYLINNKAIDVINSIDRSFWLADDWRKLSNLGINIYISKVPLFYESQILPSDIGNPIDDFHSLTNSPASQVIKILYGTFHRMTNLKFYRD